MFLARAALLDNTSWIKPGAILDLDFVNGRYYWKGLLHSLSELTYAGGANSTFVDSGKILRATDGTPRRTYDIATGAPMGYLNEPACTNLCLYSDDLTNAAWTASNMTTAMTATGPDGVANSATTLTATAANATMLQAITSASASRITSVYIKRRTGSGTVNITHDNGTTWAVVTVTSAWTRVKNAASTAANPTVGIRLVTDTDAVDVYGFQHEVTVIGTACVTSLVRTTSATVTRTATSLILSSSVFGLVSHTGISAFIEWAPLGNYAAAFNMENATGLNVNRVSAGGNAFELNLLVYTAAGSLVVNSAGGVSAIDTFNKTALGHELNNSRHAFNGTLQGADDTSCDLANPDTLYVGGLKSATGHVGSYVKRLAIWNRRLPNETLQSLTV